MDRAAVLEQLGTDQDSGLAPAEAARRLAQAGRNELVESGARSPWKILWEQLTARMVLVLIAAGIVSALLADYKDAIAIAAIVVLNAALGFSQDFRAEKAIAALKKLAAPFVKVRRGGEIREIPAAELVPGDIVLLEAGNLASADCRLLETADLQMIEASLTGESEPIRKNSAPLEEIETNLADRVNMVYLGTAVTSGRGVGVVTETGMRTELGRIATMVQAVAREPTPLQGRLDHLGKILALAALFIVGVIFVLGLLRGVQIRLMLLTAVSIGVAAVPEGLPAVVTIALALGAQRMLKRKALIRKLAAVETLGSVTVICSDKTGTLTGNRMTARVLQLADARMDLTGSAGGVEGDMATEPDEPSGYRLLLGGAALCSDVVPGSESGSRDSPLPLGDPTETALVLAAARFRLRKKELDRALPRMAEVPFNSERKRMSTIHRIPSDPAQLAPALQGFCDHLDGKYLVCTKGAVDGLLQISDAVLAGGKFAPMDDRWRARLAALNDILAGNGMRVLGVAIRILGAVPTGEDLPRVENGLSFIGMIGMIDPPRQEAGPAVALCKKAGIRPIMITGDHPLTAQSIANELGIQGPGPALTGLGLDRTPPDELDRIVDATSVYARVSPKHKLRIVEGLQRRGEIVAMTGDGVNDAPALKKADIGVAMGVTGTDVAKEAADMVLLDDNFATIVAAVEEGRVIYDNIRKFIRYILTTNSGEIWVMLLAPFLGMPLPLLPLQILWMNLVTDGLPALALGVEPAESDTMRRPPYSPAESIFARGMARQIILVGLLMGLISLGVGFVYWRKNDPAWQTIVFSTVTLSQMANVLAVRSERRSVFQVGLFSNKPLLGAVLLTFFLQLALIYLPFLQEFFHTTALPADHLAIVLVLSSLIFLAVEVEKWLTRVITRRARR
jgi:P-type Ca2+ transporter type 2C